jgi:hypothetical protein
MAEKIVARWQDWSGDSTEHLVLCAGTREITADAVILARHGDDLFAVRYSIMCNQAWRARKVQIARIGAEHPLELKSDGAGNWVDGSGVVQARLAGAIDIDISITPFTNTLPIRRLNMHNTERQEIRVVYILLPDQEISIDCQRYTCLESGRRFRYESVDSDFTRDIEVDKHGLVVTYPGLFRRLR